jgi:cation transport regulator ChaC
VFVFAYGSLLRRAEPVATCRLHGFRRGWDVAMDNRLTLPAYKFFRDPVTHERPAVVVTFLNIRADGDGRLNGVLFAVDEALVGLLDRRERQYERRDVSDQIDGDHGGRVWAYVGRAEARRRYERGRADGTAVISRQYLDGVRADFDAYGMLPEFERTTEPPDVPVLDLERIATPA